MKITVEQTPTGLAYRGDGHLITWQEVRDATGLDRGLSRLLLKKAAQSGEDVADLLEWRDRNVVIWKLEKALCHSA